MLKRVALLVVALVFIGGVMFAIPNPDEGRGIIPNSSKPGHGSQMIPNPDEGRGIIPRAMVPSPDRDRQVAPMANINATWDTLTFPDTGNVWVHVTYDQTLPGVIISFGNSPALGYANFTGTSVDVLVPPHADGYDWIYEIPNPSDGRGILPLRGLWVNQSPIGMSAKSNRLPSPDTDRPANG